jgi:hypothetical protein
MKYYVEEMVDRLVSLLCRNPLTERGLRLDLLGVAKRK